jgi:HEPN domain-containing protein
MKTSLDHLPDNKRAKLDAVTALLVITGYKEKSHDLEALGKSAAAQHPRLEGALPRGAPDDERLFILLKKAYIDARYSRSYRVTPDELAAMKTRVLGLAERVREVCLEKLASFCGPDAVSPSLPAPPALDEPLPAGLPTPPDDPAELGRWARGVAELADLRAREGEARGREEGKAEGLREGELRGEARGKAEGLRAAVLDLCEAFGIAPTDEQRARLGAMGVDEIEALRRAIKLARRWPA